MMNSWIIAFLFSTLLLTQSYNDNVGTAPGQIPVVDFDGLEEYLGQFRDKTVVVNFWATWCKPCVKELPYFEEATSHYNEDEVVVVLVSLDFAKKMDSSLKPFVKEKKLQSRVVLLDAPDANKWIDRVSPEWSGAIPATIIIKGDKRAFYEQSFDSFKDLDQIIQPFLNS